MKVDVGIWDRLSRLVLLLLFLAGVLAVALWYRPLINENERRRKELAEKHILVQQLEESKNQLDALKRALTSDPRAIERVAREQFGYIKPGETRIQFEPAPAPARPHP